MQDKELSCYLTLDYELFLGSNSGTVDNCLIIPSSELCMMLDRHGVKANFFVDAAYLLRLKSLGVANEALKRDYDKVCEHINQLSWQGHSVQLHFHPQWLYSEFNEDRWLIDDSHYKIDDIEPPEIEPTLTESIDLLNSLLQTPIKAFRAGGYTINEFGLVKDIFKKKGISIDSSALRGMKYNSEFQSYDYTNIPSLSCYHFENDICKEEENGFFTEYPISTMPIVGLKALSDGYKIKYSREVKANKAWGDGKSVKPSIIKKSKIEKFLAYFTPSHRVASIDGVKAEWLTDVVQYNNRYGKEVVIIGHPKLITPNSIKCLETFIVNNRHVRFKNF